MLYAICGLLFLAVAFLSFGGRSGTVAESLLNGILVLLGDREAHLLTVVLLLVIELRQRVGQRFVVGTAVAEAAVLRCRSKERGREPWLPKAVLQDSGHCCRDGAS